MSKIEERVKNTVEEVQGILGERRTSDTRGTEDAGIGEIPWKGGDGGSKVGQGDGTETQGTVFPKGK